MAGSIAQNSSTSQHAHTTAEGQMDVAHNNSASGLSLDGTTYVSVAEILALPEDERSALAKRLGVTSWEPLTFKVVGTPAHKYEAMSHEAMKKEMKEAKPIPDDDE